MAYTSADQALARLQGAHAALLKQSDLQFRFANAAPPKPDPFQAWLARLMQGVFKGVGNLLRPLSKLFHPVRALVGKAMDAVMAQLAKLFGPAAPYVFWSIVALLAVGLGFVLYLVARHWLRLRRGKAPGKSSLEAGETWRPAPEQALALLEEADRLAAQGRYEEAAHLILLRSIQDMESRRPRAVAPSLTSRDIAALKDLTPAARDTFAGIAAAVEQSLFGGRPMGGEGFGRCRQAYESFARAEVWA